ncbi:MAG TPA: hypothetical protein VML96_12920 [Egibacteraceae bacterium]|nr:hypothetical protein [Egibacteraceae bacterium]
MSDESPRPEFRVLSRTREGYNGSTMFDVQLQSIRTGNLLWARTFTDRAQALAFQAEVEADLDDLSDPEFRRKHGIPSED